MAQITAPRGTCDVLPQDAYKWQYLESVMREAGRRYGYEEARFPTFEHTELFQRGVGGATDVVQKEMYTFNDKGGRSVTLRPEGTASVMRMVLEHGLYGGLLPLKTYYIIPCFRYEKPQAGAAARIPPVRRRGVRRGRARCGLRSHRPRRAYPAHAGHFRRRA